MDDNVDNLPSDESAKSCSSLVRFTAVGLFPYNNFFCYNWANMEIARRNCVHPTWFQSPRFTDIINFILIKWNTEN